MGSFSSIYAQMCEQTSGPPLLAIDDMDGEEVEALETMRRGMRLRGNTNPDETFWNELKQLSCSNRKGLAKLLGVRPEVIARWPKIIGHYLSKVQQVDAHENGQKKPQMIPTGLGNAPATPKVKMDGPYGDSNVQSVSSPF